MEGERRRRPAREGLSGWGADEDGDGFEAEICSRVRRVRRVRSCGCG